MTQLSLFEPRLNYLFWLFKDKVVFLPRFRYEITIKNVT